MNEFKLRMGVGMKRIYGSILALATLSGCVSDKGGGQFMSQYHGSQNFSSNDGIHQGIYAPRTIPGVQGAWGAPVPVSGPYQSIAPSGEAAAKAMIANSVPLDIVQQTSFKGGMIPAGSNPIQQAMAGMPAGALTPGGMISPPGVPAMPGMPGGAPSNIKLANHTHGGHGPMMGPAAMGGMCGPNGMCQPNMGPAGAVPAMGALTGGPQAPAQIARTEVRFVEPAGMKISWFAPGPDGKPGFNAQYLESPGRYNFLQAAIYRLKLSEIPNRPGLELYPTLEVVPSTGKTNTFIAHSSVPVSFTEEDFQQVAAGNFVVKVVYLPDPQFQDLASAGGLDEVVSSRLEPGVDPIAEAQRRGSILLIVRLGNIDLEAPNTPAMDAPPGGGMRMPAPGQMPMNPGMGRMVPYGIMGPGAGPANMQAPAEAAPQFIPGAPAILPPANPGVKSPTSAAPLTLPVPEAPTVKGKGDEETIILKKETLPGTGLEVVPKANGITTKPVEAKPVVGPSSIPPFVTK